MDGILYAIAVMALGALVLGALLGYASTRFKVEETRSLKRSTVFCRKPNAASAAFPVADPTPKPSPKTKPISTSAPGGDENIHKLAELLGKEYKPLSAEHGVEKPKQVAYIDEQTCIGCTLCIQACPVDAIVGAAKQMHTIVADLCTGCELCIPPCPVECISMETVGDTLDTWKWQKPGTPKRVIPIVAVTSTVQAA